MSIDTIRSTPAPATSSAAVQTASLPAGAAAAGAGAAGDHGFSFHDVLDTINPLQHLPVISTIYRHMTGDTMSNTARVIGDTLYGGPVGLATGLISAHMVNENGKDIGDRVLAMVSGDDTPATAAAQTASAATAVPATAPDVPAAAPAAPKGPVTAIPKSATPSVTLSALPSKPPPVLMPQLPPAGSMMPGASVAGATPAGQNAAAMASLSIPGMASAALAPTSSLPSMGSPKTAAALAVAAPITPQTVQLQGLTPQTPASQPPVQSAIALPMAAGSRGIAIDTSQQGILAMQAHAHGHQPVPLQLTAGALPARADAPVTVQTAAPVSGNDFANRMKLGLEKYQAMMQQQNAAAAAPMAAGS